jgi:2-phosphoglycolate phosphatase
MSLKAVFFDLDGTLLDSAPDFFVAMHQLMDEYQQPRVDEASIRATVSDGGRALTTLGFGLDVGDDGFDERHQRLLDIYAEHMGQHCVLFPGIDTLIRQLKSASLFWGIITNKPARFTDPIVASMTLPAHPHLVICPDHVSNTKPDPEALILACNKVGCTPAEAIYVGDHQRDIDCGIRAGSPTIAVTFGYTKTDDDILSWNADYIAHNSEDIWAAVQDYTNHDANKNINNRQVNELYMNKVRMNKVPMNK